MANFIQIPLKSSGKTYNVRPEKLPKYETLNEILKAERPDLSIWIKLALEYYKRSKIGTFINLLESTHTFASLDYEDNKLDQIKVLDMMAAFYVQMANREKRHSKRSELIKKATQLYTAANKVFVHDPYHLLGRAYTSLLKDDEKNTAEADNQFDAILSQLLNNNTPAKLGILCNAFKKKDYPSALSYFISVLSSNPENFSDNQLGIAYCHWKAGDIKKAELAFEFILTLDPKSVDALMAFAVMKLNIEKPIHISLGMHLISQASVLEESDSDALNQLSNHFFYKKEYKTAEMFAKHAFKKAENNLMKAESCFQMAKLYHVQKNYDMALQYYIQSTMFGPSEYLRPYFGLAQMYYYKKDREKAIQCFEKVIKADPENFKAIKIISTLCAASKDQRHLDIGKTYLETLIEKYPDDDENWTYLGQILEKTDPESGLSAYNKALDIMRNKKDKFISPELFNNIASLNYKLEKFDESRLKFEEALRLCEKLVDNDPYYYKPIIIMTKYNLGRNFEELRQFQKAQTLYKEILKEHPNYTDCYLRLGCIARNVNQIQEAFDYFTEAIRFDHNNYSAWIFLGELHIAKAQWECAEKKFNRILRNPSTLNDSSSLITLGFYWLQTLYDTMKNKNHGTVYQNLAIEYFTKVLKNDTTNIWAANGIDWVLAYKYCFLEVRHVFAQLEDGSDDFCSVLLNIARVHFEEKQYSHAIKMYKQCIKRFLKHDDVEILQYLGGAYFKAGELQSSKNVCLKAFRITPYDYFAMFNVAFVVQKLSIQIIKYERSQLKDVLKAITELEVSQRFFQCLSVLDECKYFFVPYAGFEAKECQKFLDITKDFVAQARVLVNEDSGMHLKQERKTEVLKIKKNEEKISQEEKKIDISNELDVLNIKENEEKISQEEKKIDISNGLDEYKEKSKAPKRRRRNNKNKQCKNENAAPVPDNSKDSIDDNDKKKRTRKSHRRRKNKNVIQNVNTMETCSETDKCTSKAIISTSNSDNNESGIIHDVSNPSKERSSHSLDGGSKTDSTNGTNSRLHSGSETKSESGGE